MNTTTKYTLPEEPNEFWTTSRIAIIIILLFFLRKQVSYPAVSVPAAALAFRYEFLLSRDGISSIRYSFLALVIPWIGTFVHRLVKTRQRFHNLPGVPHSYLLGHLPTFIKETMAFPPDIHGQIPMDTIVDKYDLRKKGLFYLDTYPIQSTPMLVIVDADVAAQVTQGKNSWPKHPTLAVDFGRAVGPRGVFLQEDENWKELRTMFNPGFSQANLMAMVPMLVEEGEIFASCLSKIAANGGFIEAMDSIAAALTVDIIGQALLGVKFHTQTTERGVLVRSIIETSRLVMSLTNITPQRFNLWRLAKVRYYDYYANSELSAVLLKKWKELVAAPEAAQKSNVIFDIAMDKYMRRGGKLEGHISKDFLELMRDNVKTFIFAGHDTTSAVITWAFYTLSQNPECLEELRREHDEVLGPDPDEAGRRLREDPHLTNSLPYTTAVIREVMRVFGPASTVREAPPGATLVGRDGKSYPTDGLIVWVSNFNIMTDPELYPSPHSFIPTRFIPERSPFPPIPKNAYRAFEKGARDCIGQELAMLESRIVLALTVRKFDFREAYDELDKVLNRKPPPVYESCKDFGERAYQVLWTAGKPKDGLPMWVTERERKKEQ